MSKLEVVMKLLRQLLQTYRMKYRYKYSAYFLSSVITYFHPKLNAGYSNIFIFYVYLAEVQGMRILLTAPIKYPKNTNALI